MIQRSEQLKFVILEIRQPIGHLNFLPRTQTVILRRPAANVVERALKCRHGLCEADTP